MVWQKITSAAASNVDRLTLSLDSKDSFPPVFPSTIQFKLPPVTMRDRRYGRRRAIHATHAGRVAKTATIQFNKEIARAR